VNKKNQDALYLSSGIIGALVILYDFAQAQTQIDLCYVIGASFMLISAIYFKFTYFVALEMIVIAGHGAVLLDLGTKAQIVLPILLCVQFLAYYLLSGQLNNIFRLVGIIGIALVSIAFSFANQWIFMFGCLCIAFFSFYLVYRGRIVALLWAVLNMTIVIISFFRPIF
jgi:hypothetical protein